MKKTLHVQIEDGVRRLAAIRASELQVSVSEHVSSLIEKDAKAAGLGQYLARQSRQNREEVCDD